MDGFICCAYRENKEEAIGLQSLGFEPRASHGVCIKTNKNETHFIYSLTKDIVLYTKQCISI